ncbi:hypothetical protein ISN45_At05g017890 [Arabidopsis thaliana x Arabidopsis arenosa]|uniref:Cox19-like CHCH family protein n=1 Tax=Arabidopsis thaliana x Arabidopsis arenosa TaxID=1240361 RepID=A0A8T2CQV4_9BRAS|nr:hypothetical protein ISN45_At05g017890 [Arabidopsis thaliana x Arabidopsis arenosa]
MEKVTENPNSETQPSPAPPPNHQMDADDDDENVKQLKECSSLYLSLQDCLVDSNRDWKSCQKRTSLSLSLSQFVNSEI